jgi:hypothetical protein
MWAVAISEKKRLGIQAVLNVLGWPAFGHSIKLTAGN